MGNRTVEQLNHWNRGVQYYRYEALTSNEEQNASSQCSAVWVEK